MADATQLVLAVSVLIVFAAMGLCMFALVWFGRRTQATINTLDQLYRLSNDRALDACDFHLQAKRDEWDGKNNAPTPGRREPATVADPVDTEGGRLSWTDVPATENGR